MTIHPARPRITGATSSGANGDRASSPEPRAGPTIAESEYPSPIPETPLVRSSMVLNPSANAWATTGIKEAMKPKITLRPNRAPTRAIFSVIMPRIERERLAPNRESPSRAPRNPTLRNLGKFDASAWRPQKRLPATKHIEAPDMIQASDASPMLAARPRGTSSGASICCAEKTTRMAKPGALTTSSEYAGPEWLVGGKMFRLSDWALWC